MMHKSVVVIVASWIAIHFLCSVTAAFSLVGTRDFSRLLSSRLQASSSSQEDDAQADITINRRQVLVSSLFGTTLLLSSPSNAVIKDERSTFGNTDYDSSYNVQPPPPATTTSSLEPSDEIVIVATPQDFDKKGLGLELGEVEFRTNTRVVVKSILPNSPAARLGIQKDYIVVSVNGQSAERTNAEGVAIMVSRAIKDGKSIEFRFRDATAFNEGLRNLKENQVVTTEVAPAGDTTQRKVDGSVKRGFEETTQTTQRISVQQLVAPKMCNRGATFDDLLEISYLGTLADTGQVFDGSAISIDGKGIQGRGNDVSLFFVLGKQPFGQFPPGWDVGLEGMCVGERRRLIIPPALAYGSKGVPRRGIPPDATLQYDITLVSINGLATPQ